MKTVVADRASSVTNAVADAAGALVEYVDPLARDEKLRRRLTAAILAATAARRRVDQQTGMTGLARRLGSDPVLRAQLVELGTQLQEARKRARKARSRKLRNAVLLLSGMSLVIAAVPAARQKLASIVGARRGNPTPSTWSPSAQKQTTIEYEPEATAAGGEAT